MSKLCIDLCSGLGGFSQAFKNASDWEVVRIDIERKFKPDICADVRFLPLRQDIQVDVIVASPPCERFSIANSTFPKSGIGLALTLVGACLEAVVQYHPRHWLLENPKGRLRWFLGKPYHCVNLSDYGAISKKPTDLWGNIPFPIVDSIKPYSLTWNEHRQRYETPLRLKVRKPSERALMPLGLSQAVLDAVQEVH
ncbi:MAG: DNA cytosine methyltransferase [Nitrososphaerales archaeon]